MAGSQFISRAKLLNLRRKALVETVPVRRTARRCSGCQTSNVRILMAVKFLKPLGYPPANGVKFFATVDLLEQIKDRT